MYDFLLVRHCNYSSVFYHFELADVHLYMTLKSGLEVTQGH